MHARGTCRQDEMDGATLLCQDAAGLEKLYGVKSHRAVAIVKRLQQLVAGPNGARCVHVAVIC